ncbi:MAG: hypothetical protein ACOYJ1_12070 [Peptococcales bacterium]|jgi:hypothetical protein
MFYAKAKISDTTNITVELHDDNIFSICPGCGNEVEIDLAELLGNGECDLYGTAVYCLSCSKRKLGVLR